MASRPPSNSDPLAGMVNVLRRPIVWAQAAVIVCAYCGYKGLDNYSLYAVQVLGMDEVAAAKFTAYATFLRPVAAITAGLVADRFSTSKIIAVTFSILILCYGLLAVAVPSAGWLNIIYVQRSIIQELRKIIWQFHDDLVNVAHILRFESLILHI